MGWFIVALLLGVGGAGATLAAGAEEDREKRKATSRLAVLLFALLGGWTALSIPRWIPSATCAAPSFMGAVSTGPGSVKCTPGFVLKLPWERLNYVSWGASLLERNAKDGNAASINVASNRIDVDAVCMYRVKRGAINTLLANSVPYQRLVETACGSGLRKAGTVFTPDGQPVRDKDGKVVELTLDEALGPARQQLEKNATAAFRESMGGLLSDAGVSPDTITGMRVAIRDARPKPAIENAIAARQALAEKAKGSVFLAEIARNTANADSLMADAVIKFKASLLKQDARVVGPISTDEGLRILEGISQAKIAEKGTNWGAVGVPNLSLTPPAR